MSDAKLNISHKVFAAIERMIKETQVKSLDLSIPAGVSAIDATIDVTLNQWPTSFTTALQSLPTTIATDVVEVVGQLLGTAVHDAHMEALDTQVVDEKVEALFTTAVTDEPIQFDQVKVKDFFKVFKVKTNLDYETTVKNIDFTTLKTRNFSLPITLSARTDENLFFFRRLNVERPPAMLSLLSEEEQLTYWRLAVMQTRKEPRQLMIVGVYKGIPFDAIEDIRVNFSHKSLCYRFKAHPPRNTLQKDIAIFSHIDTQKIIMVVK